LTTFSFSIKRLTALADSTLSDLLSTTNSSTFLPRTVAHFLVGHLHAFQFQLAAKGILAGQGQKDANFDGVIGCQGHAGEAANHGQNHAQDSKSFHQKNLQGER
jgi:hypothetical protein